MQKEFLKSMKSAIASPIPEGYSFRVRLDADYQAIMFLVCACYQELTDTRLHCVHDYNGGCFCVDDDRDDITDEIASDVDQLVREIIERDGKIQTFTVDRADLIEYFQFLHYDDKVSLLNQMSTDRVSVAKVNSYVDVLFQPMQTNLEKLCRFEIRACNNGLFIRIPTLLSGGELSEWTGPSKHYRLMCDFGKWAKVIRSNSVAELNEIIANDQVPEVNEHCIDFNKRELESVANQLISMFPEKRLISIAGPSSSGKSTFSKLIFDILKSRGYDCLVVSMDNFYKMRVNIPVGPDGLKDFECLEAFDDDLLAERIRALLRGETVPEHHYSFVTGINWDEPEKTLSLKEKGFLILEGIHSLNPILLDKISKDYAIKVYVGPMTPLSIDCEHIFPQSDLRLIRRVIRDDKSRGYPARASVRQWTSVRIGEEKNISPNIELADLYFNSSLVYELNVLSTFGIPLLEGALNLLDDEVPGSVEAEEVTAEVKRLISLLSLLKTLPLNEVPKDSCIHEFL